MQQSRVISCAWPHRPMRTVAFILSLLPCPTRFVTWCEERASFLCVAARAISHGGLYIFVTAFPCPVRYPVEGKVYFLSCACRGSALDALPNSIRSNTISCRAGPWSRRCEFAERQRKFQTRPARREQAPALRMLNFCGSGELTNSFRGSTILP